MAVRKELINGTYTVSFSKRHPISRMPLSLKRKGIKSKQEAERVYRLLVIEIENRLKRIVVPTWSKVVEDFYDYSKLRGISEKTLESYMFCLRSHTSVVWGMIFPRKSGHAN